MRRFRCSSSVCFTWPLSALLDLQYTSALLHTSLLYFTSVCCTSPPSALLDLPRTIMQQLSRTIMQHLVSPASYNNAAAPLMQQLCLLYFTSVCFTSPLSALLHLPRTITQLCTLVQVPHTTNYSCCIAGTTTWRGIWRVMRPSEWKPSANTTARTTPSRRSSSSAQERLFPLLFFSLFFPFSFFLQDQVLFSSSLFSHLLFIFFVKYPTNFFFIF